MLELLELVNKADTVAIAGHLCPDGDSVGSCLGVYNYLTREFKGQKQIDVYQESVPAEFSFLENAQIIRAEAAPDKIYDLFIALDCSSVDRLGFAEAMFHKAKTTVNIDHHISNTNFAQYNHVEGEASSACEVVYGLMDKDKIDQKIAECLYLGIVHDTGVFKHSNTSKKTMEVAGCLLETGISSSQIIDDSFYRKTYLQNQILGRCLLESILLLNGRIIFSFVPQKIMQLYGAVPSDLDGIIDQLRVTEGVEVAILVREEETQRNKVSMRSNGKVDVSRICEMFGGGGHKMAAGCTINGSIHDVVNNLSVQIEHQLNAYTEQ
ncbi:MAG: bifunctional oligoribonuclease/PAP phosphatase NrnA [Lachnospiraceae bacterium]|nr:bifunctional oligoribonuclease/PAP phosphatase NrnA [Lachnospiraceae bacterium]